MVTLTGYFTYSFRLSSLQFKVFSFSESVKSQYEAIIDIASNYLSSTKIALLKFSLAIRAYSPAVESFHQVNAYFL